MTTTRTASPSSTDAARVVIVDDDPGILTAVTRVLERAGHHVSSFADPLKAQAALVDDDSVDVAVLDVMLPNISGIDLLRLAKAKHPHLVVVMMTANTSIATAVEAVKAGAFDYMTKPFESLEKIVLTVQRAHEHRQLVDQNRRLETALEAKNAFEDLIGQSPKMKGVFELIEAVAPTPATVLVRGESGTGKELVARAIHRRSERNKMPFHAINCSALTETMLDGELFGHVKGAFTGAMANRKGLFEAAHGGTLFLDEIGDVSPATQVRLLRVLQEGEVKPVGSNDTVTVDVRVVAATNVDLQAAIAKKAFREDLYYRLNVLSIDLPPLRSRPEDIMLLAMHFLGKHAKKMKKQSVTSFTDNAVRALTTHDWPGNVRELENAVARALVLCGGPAIEPAHLPPGVGGAVPLADVEATGLAHLPYAHAKKSALASFERNYLGAKLKASAGNISKAARDAGMDRSNFKRLLREYGVVPDGALSGEGEPTAD